MFEEKDSEEAIVKASVVERIIVRSSLLTNGVRTGKYRVLTEMNGVTAGKISRVDVADFILQKLLQPTFIKQTPPNE